MSLFLVCYGKRRFFISEFIKLDKDNLVYYTPLAKDLNNLQGNSRSLDSSP
ncbi:MAG: hypothetical protein XD90_1128 [Methanobacterium sp. 42_16]|jgi:hypothetical protein|nr:MAG: hypothetical protein XD90_1128 [Methanobacterium sp. 42_16]